MNQKAGIKMEAEVIIEAIPPEGGSMEQLEQKLKEQGIKIISKTESGFMIGYEKETVLKIQSKE